MRYRDTIATISRASRYLFREVSSCPKRCDTPPWHFVSHRHTCAIPHFATHHAIIVRYPMKTSTNSFAILWLQESRDMKSIAVGPLSPDPLRWYFPRKVHISRLGLCTGSAGWDRKSLPIAKNQELSEQFGPSVHKMKAFRMNSHQKASRTSTKTWEDKFLGVPSLAPR